MSKTPEPAKEKKDRKNEKNFKLSDEALSLVLKASGSRGNMSNFVSRCIEKCGPALLPDFDGSSGKKASLDNRLDYLEKVVVDLAYDALISSFDTATRKAHQAVLKVVNKKSWYSTKSLKAVLDAAQGNPKTADTPVQHWQTLMQCRKKFLAVKK